MKIDAHQHFWQYNPLEHPWINEAMAILKRDYLPAHLQPELIATGFDGCVVVQASQTEVETEFLLRLAEENSFIKGVVGWVDLRAENVAERLEYLAQHSLLKGVRHVVQDEPDDQFLLRPDFMRGISYLANFDLTYDLLIYPKQLPTAIRLVEKFPNQPFVLDHLAKPFIKDKKIDPWKADIQTLAQFPNVQCKLSGMVTEATWGTWQETDFYPYLDVVFQTFGTDRLMIGSDWPVCLLSGKYARTLSIVENYIQNLPAEQQANILGENAVRFYRLSEAYARTVYRTDIILVSIVGEEPFSFLRICIFLLVFAIHTSSILTKSALSEKRTLLPIKDC